jgi:hypothetical protein
MDGGIILNLAEGILDGVGSCEVLRLVPEAPSSFDLRFAAALRYRTMMGRAEGDHPMEM